MESKKYSKDSKTIMTELVMPNDTNPLNNLMGGNLMRWMDIAGGICAGKHCEAYVVTAAVDHVSFQHPIRLGDVIELEASVTRAFGTSVEVFVEVFALSIKGKNKKKTNQAYFTFVGIDDETRKPCKVPTLVPLGTEEEAQFKSASRRRELRLIQSGRMKPEDAKEIKSFFKDK